MFERFFEWYWRRVREGYTPRVNFAIAFIGTIIVAMCIFANVTHLLPLTGRMLLIEPVIVICVAYWWVDWYRSLRR